jgi:hypothetical protein
LRTIHHAIANDRRSFFRRRSFAAASVLTVGQGREVVPIALEKGNCIQRGRQHGSMRKSYDLNANQIAMTMSATMMVPHTAGVTRFELPLRGESLAAWSNFM